MYHTFGSFSCHVGCTVGQDHTYLEDLSISIKHIDSDFNVLLDALSSSLEIPSLQSQVQVITDVTWEQK